MMAAPVVNEDPAASQGARRLFCAKLLVGGASLCAMLFRQLDARAHETGPEVDRHEPIDGAGKRVRIAIRYEARLEGLQEGLDEKFKLRVTDVTIAPGAVVADHAYAGAGIRQVMSGNLVVTAQGKTVTYGPGDFFFAPGNVRHALINRSQDPCVVMLFEVLPSDVRTASVISVENSR
jgi:quercetin dioxygenase-like cupin family protein